MSQYRVKELRKKGFSDYSIIMGKCYYRKRNEEKL